MLDHYINGSLIKYCDNSDIPILKVKESKMFLGGAANVVNNLNAFGCNIIVNGIIGNDLNGKVLRDKLSKVSNISGLFHVSNNTITKNTISMDDKKIIRYDFEDEINIDCRLQLKLMRFLDYIIDKSLNAIIISDYSKGICKDEICKFIIEKALYLKIPVFVDSKDDNWEKYKGAYLVTPNIKDFRRIQSSIKDEEQLFNIAKEVLIEGFNISKVILTCSEDGLVYLDHNCIQNIPAYSKQVIDSTGCGDTLIAAIANYMNFEVPFLDVLKIASVAAGIVAVKKNTAIVTHEELIGEVEKNNYSWFSSKLRLNNKDSLNGISNLC